MRPLFGLHNQQLSEILQEFSVSAYRVGQLSQAIYRNWTEDLADVTNLPKDLRDRLTQAGYHIGLPSIAETYKSVDGTERYLISTSDGQTVETVWMPEGDDGEPETGARPATTTPPSACRARSAALSTASSA